VLLGADFQAMAQNQGRNLQEGRIVLGQVVARKSALFNDATPAGEGG